jgi:hypothetical protein
MPRNRKLRHGLLLLERLLHPILTDVTDPRRKRRADRFRPVGLGDRHDAYRVLPAPGSLALGHRSPNGSQPGREAWEVHNPLIYLGMLGY